jgi:hypothetical protein
MAIAVYILCALASASCAVILISSYRKSRQEFLLWSGACFVGLAWNNLFLLCDYIFAPEMDFSIARNLSGALGTAFLIFGLLWKQSADFSETD